MIHEHTKHIDIDRDLIIEKVAGDSTGLTSTKDQVVNFLTKAMIKKQLCDVLSKLGMVNIYTPA